MSVRLLEESDRVMAVIEGRNGPVAVKLVCARPVSARDREISVMSLDDSKELAWLSSIEELDEPSREIAERALWMSYRIPRITRIVESHVNHGHRYLKVETDRGDRFFNLREPGNNVTRLSSDHLVIRDSMGNRYEIVSVAALDEASRVCLERVL